MINDLIKYMINNKIELVFGLFFCILGAVIGNILSNRKDDSIVKTDMTYREIIIVIKEKYIVKESENSRSNNKQNSGNNSGDSNDMLAYLGVGIILSSLYSKYHIQIMSSILIFSIVSLVFILSLTINLNKRNRLDKYNKNWILLCFLIVLFNIISIFIIDTQDVTLVGIEGYSRVLSYLAGALFLILSNLLLVVIVINMWATNSFIKKPNKINSFIVSKLIHISEKFKKYALFVSLAMIMSGFFSSGIYYNLFNR